MERYVMVQTGGKGVSLAPKFPDAAAADAWAASKGIFGTPLTVAAYQAQPAQVSEAVEWARSQKVKALSQECNRRIQLISPLFDLRGAATLATLITPVGRTALGDGLVLYFDAWAVAKANITALTTLAAIEAYDVVVAPSWP